MENNKEVHRIFDMYKKYYDEKAKHILSQIEGCAKKGINHIRFHSWEDTEKNNDILKWLKREGFIFYVEDYGDDLSPILLIRWDLDNPSII